MKRKHIEHKPMPRKSARKSEAPQRFGFDHYPERQQLPPLDLPGDGEIHAGALVPLESEALSLSEIDACAHRYNQFLQFTGSREATDSVWRISKDTNRSIERIHRIYWNAVTALETELRILTANEQLHADRVIRADKYWYEKGDLLTLSYEQIEDLLDRHSIEDTAHFSLYLRAKLLAALEKPREMVEVHVLEKPDFIDIVLRMAEEIPKGPHGTFHSLQFYVFVKVRLIKRDVLVDTWNCHSDENFRCVESSVNTLIHDLLEHRDGRQAAEDADADRRRYRCRPHWGAQLPGHRCDRHLDDRLEFPEYYNCAAALRELYRAGDTGYSDDLRSKLIKRAWKEVRSNVALAVGQRLPAELHDQIVELTLSVEMPWRYLDLTCAKCRVPASTPWERLERSKTVCSCGWE